MALGLYFEVGLIRYTFLLLGTRLITGKRGKVTRIRDLTYIRGTSSSLLPSFKTQALATNLTKPRETKGVSATTLRAHSSILLFQTVTNVCSWKELTDSTEKPMIEAPYPTHDATKTAPKKKKSSVPSSSHSRSVPYALAFYALIRKKRSPIQYKNLKQSNRTI